MLLRSEGRDLLYSALLWNRAGFFLPPPALVCLDYKSCLDWVPMWLLSWPDTSPSPLLPQHVAHCDTNISLLPGEKRSLQAASPYAVTARVVFGLWMNGSLFRRGKLHPLLMVATYEKKKALWFTSLEDQSSELEETGRGKWLFRTKLVIPRVVQRTSDGGGSFLLAFLTFYTD